MGQRLEGKVAVVAAGHTRLGQIVAQSLAREGASVAVIFDMGQEEAAQEAFQLIDEAGSEAILICTDLGNERYAERTIAEVMKHLGRLDILVNHTSRQGSFSSIETLEQKELEKLFKGALYPYFYATKASLKYLPKGSVIINSILADTDSPTIDLSSLQGAQEAFTRAASALLTERSIRVNGVALGPIFDSAKPLTKKQQSALEGLGANYLQLALEERATGKILNTL